MLSIIMISGRKNPGFVEFVRSIQEWLSTQPDTYVELVFVDRLHEHRASVLKEAMDRIDQIYFKHLPDPEHTVSGPCPSSARNHAVLNSKGDWIVSVDDLTTFKTGCLDRHLRAFELGFDALAGAFETDGDEVDDRIEHGSSGLFIASRFYGMHMGFSREAWEVVGGFDEKFDGVYGQEDCDFGERMWRAGLSIGWDPRARVMCARGEDHTDLGAKTPACAFMHGQSRWKNDALIHWNRTTRTTKVRN